jgi:ribose/xylose/arabinose/galactoside ABC-type transport system permease subunit
VLTWIVLRESRLGLYLYGVGGSRTASLLAGVAVVRYEILGYTICGLLAGLAGLMLTARVSIGQAELGSGYELLSIAAAVIGGTAIGGGTASLLGVVLGSTLIQVLATGLAIAGVGPYRQQMATGAVIVIAAGVAKIRGVKLANMIPRLAATKIGNRG